MSIKPKADQGKQVSSCNVTSRQPRSKETNAVATNQEPGGKAADEVLRRESTLPRPVDANGIVPIASDGDVVLQVTHATHAFSLTHAFRVRSCSLKRHSKYFARLLEPGRFSEAAHIERTHAALHGIYGDVSAAPSDELPKIEVEDLGRTSDVRALDALLTDFLSILHDAGAPWSPPVANLANIAIVADRFDALGAVKDYVLEKNVIKHIDSRTTSKQDAALTEEKTRQRLLIAILLNHGPWLEKYSARLLSKRWVGSDLVDLSSALWWDLPSRVEEELSLRSTAILNTIASLQSHFLELYTSRARQCKLGYDSSPQCDSFQLGEMLRFFTRTQTLGFHSALTAHEPEQSGPAFVGDLPTLLDTLRQVPEYQIDKFHSHCGIRTRLVPLLDVVQECLRHVGLCADCWSRDREGYAWTDAPAPSVWKRPDFHLRGYGHETRHAEVRDMFLAKRREWT